MTASAARMPTGQRLRVLIVDDHDDARNGLAALTTEWGYDVRTAPDGARALAELDAFRPMVALLDLKLTNENGYDVALRLREQAWRRRLYIVVVTGQADLRNAAASKAAGISQHLLKPVPTEALRRILAAYQFAEEVIERGHDGPVARDG
jgi:CheY-like chemotaxis protein